MNGAFNLVEAPELVAKWQVLLVEPTGVRWGLPFEQAASAFGDAESAQILDANGSPIRQVTVYRTEATDIGAFTVLVPPSQSNWHAVQVNGAPALPFSAPISVPAP